MDRADSAFRKTVSVAIAVVARNSGFDYVEHNALETLLEMALTYMGEVGQSSRSYAELGGRSDVVPSDVSLALINMGFPLRSLPASLKHGAHVIIPPPATTTAQPAPHPLHVGKARSHPSYILSHLPPFPDPHTYIRTQSRLAPQSDYQRAREAAASQQRSVEISLINYMLSIQPSHSVFFGTEEHRLLAPIPEQRPYVSALVAAQARDVGSAAQGEFLAESGDANDEAYDDDASSERQDAFFDNPYLRPTKLPADNV